jgi:hypothetical protein
MLRAQKAVRAETGGDIPSGPRLVFGEIAQDQVLFKPLSRAKSADFRMKQA